MAPESKIQLHCAHHTIIIRNDSLEDKFPGGLEAFRRKYQPVSNDHITVYCVTNYLILDAIRELELIGLETGEDFVTIDTVECEMWRMINPDKIDQPFWLETGANWIKCKQWNGNVMVWYDR
jgi:hypothetical protein